MQIFHQKLDDKAYQRNKGHSQRLQLFGFGTSAEVAGSLNRPFSYSAKEPGSSVIFINFYTRDSIEWR